MPAWADFSLFFGFIKKEAHNEPLLLLCKIIIWVIGQNVLMANPSHQTFYPHYVSRSKQLHHPRLKDSFPIDSSHSFADK